MQGWERFRLFFEIKAVVWKWSELKKLFIQSVEYKFDVSIQMEWNLFLR